MQPSPRPTLPVSPSQTLSTELYEPVGSLLAMVAGTPNGPHGLKLHVGEFQNPHVLHTQASPATSEQKLARVLQDVLGEEAPCHDLVAGTHADFAMRRYPCSMYFGAWQSTCTKHTLLSVCSCNLICAFLTTMADGRIRSQALHQRLQARLDSITQVLSQCCMTHDVPCTEPPSLHSCFGTGQSQMSAYCIPGCGRHV